MLRVILFIVLPVFLQSFQLSKLNGLRTSVSSRQMNTKMLLSPHDIIDSFTSLSHLDPQLLINDHIPSFLLSLDDVTDATTKSASAVVEAASPYSKIDKTGVIGFIASYVELAIDGGHSLLQSVGVKYSYGFSIIIFTLFGKKTIYMCMYFVYINRIYIIYL